MIAKGFGVPIAKTLRLSGLAIIMIQKIKMERDVLFIHLFVSVNISKMFAQTVA